MNILHNKVKYVKKIDFIGWVTILSLLFFSFTIIKTAYDKNNLENTVIKTVKSKFVTNRGKYILVSEDKYFVEVSSDDYDYINVGDERRDSWVE